MDKVFIKQFLAREKERLKQEKNEFLKLDDEIERGMRTATRKEWENIYEKATWPGNKLTNYEYSLLPNTFNHSDYFFAYSGAEMFFQDSEEIIEPPIKREVLACYDEEIKEVEKLEKWSNKLDWNTVTSSPINDNWKAGERDGFFREIEELTTIIEKINEEFASRNERSCCIIKAKTIPDLPIEMKLLLLKYFHFAYYEEKELDELFLSKWGVKDIEEILKFNTRESLKESKGKLHQLILDNVREIFSITYPDSKRLFHTLYSIFAEKINCWEIKELEGKLERVEQQKDKQIKQKNQIDSKYQQQIKNTKKLAANYEKIKKEQTNFRDTAIKLAKERVKAKKLSISQDKIKKRNLELKNNFVDKQNKINDLQSKITAAEQDLGVSLDNLSAELEGKTITEYKKRERERERERDDFVGKLTKAQEQLEQQKGYEEIKQERDQLKIELNQKESSIIAKIISELKLGLGEKTNLEQALGKIKELITNKTPDTSQENNLTNLRQQITKKEQEIKELRNRDKENYVPKETIEEQVKKNLKQLGIKSSTYQNKITKFTSFQELERYRQETIKEVIDQEKEKRNDAEKLNIVLWILVISSLLTIVFLMVKMSRSSLLTKTKKLKEK